MGSHTEDALREVIKSLEVTIALQAEEIVYLEQHFDEVVDDLEEDLDQQGAEITELENKLSETNAPRRPTALDDELIMSLESIVDSYANVVDRSTLTENEVAKYISSRYSGMEVEWQLILMAVVMSQIEEWKVTADLESVLHAY